MKGKGEVVANRTIHFVASGASPEGGTSYWTDMVIDHLRTQEFKGEKYATTVKSDAKGKFKIWCLESSGNFDLLVAQDSNMTTPDGTPPAAPLRITNILSRATPIEIHVQ